jgi:vitamin B12 transporter
MDNSNLKKDSIVTIYTGVGSFGQINGGLKLNFQVNQHLLAESKLFYGKIENDFKYSLRGEEVSQPNAAINRMGMSQKFSYLKKDHRLFSEVAYAKNDREIQPTKTGANRDHLETEIIRGVISHEHFINDLTLISSLGYAGETTLYNQLSKTITHLFSGQYTVELPLAPFVSSRFGVSTIQTWGQSANYSNTKQAGQVHIYSSFSVVPSDNVRFTLNLREAFHGLKTIFVPSFGAESTVGVWTFRTQISKGYRVPTFNDRFWNSGGNPDLEPEKSRNYEVGIDLDKSKTTFSATAFYSKVEDWIQWTQDIDSHGIWFPKNLKKVTSNGIELNAIQRFSMLNLNLEWTADYEYILSTDDTSEESNQLPYVPKHSGFSSIALKKNTFSFKIRANYTSVRYTTLTNSPQNSIDDYALIDVILAESRMFRKPNIGLKLSLNNVFNTDYENVKNTAMPGRNFLTELTIKF